jgi:branched-chain amino acid transport system substrate-binding protein
MKKLHLNSILFALVFLFSCKGDSDPAMRTVKIGGLYSITGNWSSLGKASQSAMNLALEDVNNFLEETGSIYRLSTVVSDTKLETTTALSAIERNVKDGVQVFIGPQSSAEIAAIKDFVDENEVLIVSQGSTASSLAFNDGIFRLCPGDAVEGEAISRSMYASGKRIIIALARNDAGNIGLQTSVKDSFVNLGGQVDVILPYSPDLTNFSALIQALRSKIQQYSDEVGASKVGVYIASFDELVNLFSQATNDQILSSVNWYGGDGVVQSAALLDNASARRFAIKTNFFAPNFGLPAQPHPDLNRISAAIFSDSGIEPDAYALSVYDAMWVIGKTLATHKNVLTDYEKLKESFATEANQFFGITGPVLLNDKGDRDIGSFDYWGIVEENGVFSWKVVGKSN